MSKQLHKNFTHDQVKSLLKKYSKGEIKLNYVLQILRIKRRRFFELLASALYPISWTPRKSAIIIT